MFAAEFREHGIEAGSLRRDVDHIGGNVASSRLELVDLFRVCRENLFLWRIGGGWISRFPDFVVDANTRKMFNDIVFLGQHPALIRYSKHRHYFLLFAPG